MKKYLENMDKINNIVNILNGLNDIMASLPKGPSEGNYKVINEMSNEIIEKMKEIYIKILDNLKEFKIDETSSPEIREIEKLAGTSSVFPERDFIKNDIDDFFSSGNSDL